MNASRVLRTFAWLVLASVGVFSYTGQARAQEVTAPSAPETVDYTTPSVEILSPYVAGDENSQDLVFSLLLKNNSPDQQNYRLGVDFRESTGQGSDRLYIARAPKSYTVNGNTQERVNFTLPSPSFLSGIYTVSVGVSDEKGNPVGMMKLDDMKFSGTERVSLSDCTFAGQALADGIRIKEADTAKASVACKASWNGEEASTANVVLRLVDSRYAAAFEVGQTELSLSQETSSVTSSLTQVLPAGFYQLEIAPMSSDGRPMGVPVRTSIAVEGVGGKIVAIADTAVEQKEGKSVVPVSVLTEMYDDSSYALSLSLVSEGAACAAPLKLSLDPATSNNESTREFSINKECRYPVIMATLTTADGKKLDQAVRAFGERVPHMANKPSTPTMNEMMPTSMGSLGLMLLFLVPVLIVIIYLARKRMRTGSSKVMMPLFFLVAISALFSVWTGQAQAANKFFYLNYNCTSRPCPEATTIWKIYTTKDVFSPGESIYVHESIGSDDWPIAPTGGIVEFAVNGSNWTDDLDKNPSYTAQQLRIGVDNDYNDVKMKAPTTPGNFTLTIYTSMGGYTPKQESITLRVEGSKLECASPGWGEDEAVYDGWADSAPGWCSKYQGGVCTSGYGGNSPSSRGSVVSCCDKDASKDNVAYVRYCQGGRGGGSVDVTMTGTKKEVGFWKGFMNAANASGQAVNIPFGGTVLLDWTSKNASFCTLTLPSGGVHVPTNYTDYPVTGLSRGTHILTIDCEDSTGTKTDSDFVTVNVNSAPNAPTITGPATGVINTNYDYVIRSTDPDGDTLHYGFDGDGNNTVDQFYPSTGYVNSGTNQTARKSWSTPGTYTIQAMAQDSKGQSSSFTAKTVTITNPVAAALNICPTDRTINEGTATQLAAYYTPTGTQFTSCTPSPNGTNVANSASWSSSNSGIASVSAGKVTGVTPGGPVNIGAIYSGVSDSTPTTVTVLCVAKDSCTSQSSKDKADLVCTTDTFDIPDGCGNTLTGNGARNCDYNWKEVAP